MGVEPQYIEPNPSALGTSSDPFAKRAVKRFEKAEKDKMLFNSQFRDAYDYGMPSRPDFETGTPGEVRTDKIFDDTLVTAIPEFASELQAGLVPSQSNIFRLMAGPSVPKHERRKVQTGLDDVTHFIHSRLRESNFAEEAHEGLQDIAISTLNMLMKDIGSRGELNFEAVPIHEAFMDIGPDGRPDGRYKKHKVAYKHIEHKFHLKDVPKELAKQVKDNPDVKVTVIEGIWRNWLSVNTHEYEYFCVIQEKCLLLKKETYKGIGSNPWITARWSCSSGEAWGRGLVMNVLPTVKSLNLVLQLLFENAQVAIGGMWQYDSDGVINPDTIFLEPGTFIPRAPGSSIDPLQSPSQFDVTQFVLNDARMNVRKGMLVDSLDQEGKTPPSAQQVGFEMNKFSRRMGASYTRLMNEFVFPVVKRALYIYKKRGLIELPEIDGKTVEVVAVSPLARAQHAQDVTDFTRFLEVGQFAYGPQLMQQALDIKGIDWLADKLGVDTTVIKSAAQMQKEAEQLVQAAQENPELAQGLINGTPRNS